MALVCELIDDRLLRSVDIWARDRRGQRIPRGNDGDGLRRPCRRARHRRAVRPARAGWQDARAAPTSRAAPSCRRWSETVSPAASSASANRRATPVDPLGDRSGHRARRRLHARTATGWATGRATTTASCPRRRASKIGRVLRRADRRRAAARAARCTPRSGGPRLMFTLDELRAAAEVVRRHMPPTPQYAWPLLAEALGADGVGQAREPHADRRVQGARRPGVRRPAGPRAAGRARHRDAPPGATTARASPFAGRAAGVDVDHRRAASATAPTRTRRCGPSAPTLIEHGLDFQDAREHAAALAAERGLEMVHVVPSRSGAGRRHVRPRVVRAVARSRHRLRAGGHGIGHLRPDRRARPVGPADRDRRRGRRAGARHRVVVRGRARRSAPTLRRRSSTASPAGCPTRWPSRPS